MPRVQLDENYGQWDRHDNWIRLTWLPNKIIKKPGIEAEVGKPAEYTWPQTMGRTLLTALNMLVLLPALPYLLARNLRDWAIPLPPLKNNEPFEEPWMGWSLRRLARLGIMGPGLVLNVLFVVGTANLAGFPYALNTLQTTATIIGNMLNNLHFDLIGIAALGEAGSILTLTGLSLAASLGVSKVLHNSYKHQYRLNSPIYGQGKNLKTKNNQLTEENKTLIQQNRTLKGPYEAKIFELNNTVKRLATQVIDLGGVLPNIELNEIALTPQKAMHAENASGIRTMGQVVVVHAASKASNKP